MFPDARAAQELFRRRVPVVLRTSVPSPAWELALEASLTAALTEVGLAPLEGRLSYCLRELTGNAFKANLKRAYFREQGWNLEDPADYELGLRRFRAEALVDPRAVALRLGASPHWVEVTLRLNPEALDVEVVNSAAAVAPELARVQDRLGRAWSFDEPEQVLDQVLDPTEGAGLGLGILILTLRKMDVAPEAFTLTVEGGQTRARVVLPIAEGRRVQVAGLTTELARAVDSLPPFPQTVRRLLTLLDDPQVAFADLAEVLGRDPALTADLLKYLHSAGMGGRRTESLEASVRTLGLRPFRDLLVAFGAHRVVGKYLERQKDLWDDAVWVSAQADALAQGLKLGVADRTRARIGGLLHNLGAIIIGAVDPRRTATLRAFCRSQGYDLARYEELTHSVSSADLGAQLAERWGFPEDLTAALRHQNRPGQAPEEWRSSVIAIRAATALRAMERGWLDRSRLDAETRTLLEPLFAQVGDPQGQGRA